MATKKIFFGDSQSWLDDLERQIPGLPRSTLRQNAMHEGQDLV